MGDRLNRCVNIAILVTLAILLFHPSGILGRWIVSWHGDWREQRLIGQVWEELVNVPSVLSSEFGDPNRVIVEFVDYECVACRYVAESVTAAVREHGVTVVLRHVPRSGPRATEAALAAICAEEFRVFDQAHQALMVDEEWLHQSDWIRFGASLGIEEPEAFGECIAGGAAEDRLSRDIALADALGIPGTPTFVTQGGMHIGATSFQRAVAATLTAASERHRAILRELDPESVFDSSQHPEPEVAEFVALRAAYFVGEGDLVLIGPTELLFLKGPDRTAKVLGRAGGGPGEFTHIVDAFRVPAGLAVWDMMAQRISFYSSEGDLIRTRTFNALAFRDHIMAKPVAALADGGIVFRDGEGQMRGARGRGWHRARYLELRADDEVREILEASGNELFYGAKGSDYVVFGHRTFEAPLGDGFVVAQTAASTADVLSADGRVAAQIPLPEGEHVSPDQVEAARMLAISRWTRHFDRAREFLGTRGLDSQGDFAQNLPEPPANDMAPPIDALLVDADERLWIRHYRLPDHDSVLWQVWNPRQTLPLFELRVEADAELHDARGEHVLLSVRDEMDVAHVVVRRMTPTA